MEEGRVRLLADAEQAELRAKIERCEALIEKWRGYWDEGSAACADDLEGALR